MKSFYLKSSLICYYLWLGLKNLISERIKLRFMPEIEFKIDQSLEHTKHIYDLLDKLKKERNDERSDRGNKEKQ